MLYQATQDRIVEAAQSLRDGQLVAFPSETVYGLGADATSDAAIAAIYSAKRRPAHNPLIVHLAHASDADRYAILDLRAQTLAATLWPGPLTLVLPARPNNGISRHATANLPTIALRVPAHPVAHALLAAFDGPLAAPSANPSGLLSPTAAQHVARHFNDDANITILAGGASAIGLESTVLDLSVPEAVILRAGTITPEELEPLIGPVRFAAEGGDIKAPGQLTRHYATKTPLRLNAVDVKENEALLAFGDPKFIGVSGIGFARDMPEALYRNLSRAGDLHEAATNFYASLFELDQSGATAIAVMKIPPYGLGIALNDRLQRAATKE